MKNILFIILVILTSFILQSCSSDEETAVETQNVVDSTGASVTIDGTYAQTCDTYADNTSELTSLTLAGSTYINTYKKYSDDACATSTTEFVTGFSYAVGAAAVTTDLKAVNQVTAVIKTQVATLYTAELVAAYNEESYYGFTDWEIGTSKSIFGLNYSDGSTDAAASDTLYDIWYLSGTSLQMGEGDGTAYPTDLSSTVYTKQ